MSWGESTFIQSGLNAINHFDVSALRVPGLRAARKRSCRRRWRCFNLQFNDNVSSDQLLYLSTGTTPSPSRPAPISAQRFRGAAAASAWCSASARSPTQGVDFTPLGGPLIEDFQNVRARPDTRKPDDNGQFGSQLQVLSAELQPRHRARPLLPQLSQPPAGDLAAGPARRLGLGNAFGALNAAGAAAQAHRGGPAAQRGDRDRRGRRRACAPRRPAAISSLRWRSSTPPSARTRCSPAAMSRRRPRNLGVHEYAKTARLLHRISGRHPAARRLVQHAAAEHGHRAAGRGRLSQGRAAAVRRRRAAVRGAVAVRGRHRARCAALPLPAHLHCRRGRDALALQSARRVRPEPGDPRLGRDDIWQAQFTATKTFANMLRRVADGRGVRGGRHAHPGSRDKFSGGPTGRGLRYNAPGTSSAAIRSSPAATSAKSSRRTASRTPPRGAIASAGRLEYPNADRRLEPRCRASPGSTT